MLFDSFLDDIVLFEVPSAWSADRLLKHLESDRFTWRQPTEGAVVVGALLTDREGDLAVLLRLVQAWLDGLGIPVIRFHVDGRAYLLEATQVAQPVG